MRDLLIREGVTCTFSTRALGARDADTGHPAVTWTTTTGWVIYNVLSSRVTQKYGENVTERRLKVTSTTAFSVLDKMTIPIGGEEYEVEVEPENHYDWEGNISHYTANIVKRE